MPWKEVNVVEQRLSFVIRAMMKEESFTHLCKEFGVTPKTGYKWIRRFREEGGRGLHDESRRPKRSANRLAEDVVCELVRLKNLKKSWGPRKIRNIYAMNHRDEQIPSLSTVSRVLEKSGLVKKRKRRRIAKGERLKNHVEVKGPNDLWTVDFKGYWYSTKKEKIEPLTVRDEYSKFVLCASLPEKSDITSVKGEFERLFEEYGLPSVIRSDNGSPFASSVSVLGLTKLSAWWLSLGIRLDRIDPGSPQQNGSHERMHRDIAEEVEAVVEGDLETNRASLEVWRKEYNTERPHESLGMKTPASVYKKSTRRYEKFDAFEYPSGYRSHMVNDRGYIHCGGRRLFLTNALNGYNVGVRGNRGTGWEVWFEKEFMGRIDPVSFVFTSEMKRKEGT